MNSALMYCPPVANEIKIILHVTLKCQCWVRADEFLLDFHLQTCQCRITYKMPPQKHLTITSLNVSLFELNCPQAVTI